MFTPLFDHLHKIESALLISVEDDPFYFNIFVVRKRYDRLIRHGTPPKSPPYNRCELPDRARRSAVIWVRETRQTFYPIWLNIPWPAHRPLLKDLLKTNAIRLTLVDVPFNQHTPLYARNFLYALKENNDPEHAFRIRTILQNATNNKDITTQERIETLFKEKGIASGVWDPKPAFDRYNALIKEDKIDATPTCVIIKNGQKKAFVGEPDIVNALKALP